MIHGRLRSKVVNSAHHSSAIIMLLILLLAVIHDLGPHKNYLIRSPSTKTTLKAVHVDMLVILVLLYSSNFKVALCIHTMPYIQADLGTGVKITFQVFVCMVAIAAVAMQVSYISAECSKTIIKP